MPATHTRDFRLVKPRDIESGYPVLGGWLHLIHEQVIVNLGVGDDLEISGAIPPDETWQLLQLQITDATKAGGGFGQGWRAQTLSLLMAASRSPEATAAVPKPKSAITELVYTYPVWERVWDGVSLLTWGGLDGPYVVVRPSDPLISVHRWPPGTYWELLCHYANSASGADRGMAVVLVVLRLPVKEKLDLHSERGVQQRLLVNSEMLNRGALLRD